MNNSDAAKFQKLEFAGIRKRTNGHVYLTVLMSFHQRFITKFHLTVQ